MKILLLGKGFANRGCKRLLEKHQIPYEFSNVEEIKEKSYDYIVKSPGISLFDPVFEKIDGKVISDIELAYILEHPYIIGVTGSNGKTTVVSMLCHILKSKYNVVACGNIGYSVCDALVDYPSIDMYIVELSSFQLECIDTLDCNISVLLNISLCHLDHHKTMKHYVDSKLKMALNQGFHHWCVYNLDNPFLKDLSKEIISNAVGFSYNRSISRIYILNDYIYFKNQRIYKLKKEELRYRHKIENYLAVLSVISILDFNMKKACRLLKKFHEIKYRLTQIDTHIYNDAKSTNCASTMAALHSLSKVHFICGGYNRGMKITLDEESLRKIKVVYVYGQTKEEVYTYFKEKGILCFRFSNLKSALHSAYIKRMEDEVILFSPMFASFDQYKSYIERGEEFENEYFKLKNNVK